jgi:hypothetical protein
MDLQPFVASWPLLQFRNLFYTDGRTPWTSDQPVERPLLTHRTIQTDIHALNVNRNHDPIVRVREDQWRLVAKISGGCCSRKFLAFVL